MNEVVVSGRAPALPKADVRRAVEAVLRGERRTAHISVTFVGRSEMQRLNAEHKAHDWPTDVLTFALEDPSGVAVGDIYICPWVAAREAQSRGISARQELVRLVVHGTLHALGLDHPEGEGRTRSTMWRRQERYVQQLEAPA